MDITLKLIRTKAPLTPAQLKLAAETFLRASGVRNASLSLVLVSGTDMRRLNRRHLGHDYITDVITFDLGSGDRLEGEVIVCPAEARRNAALYGEDHGREILRYIAHGILHLLGHDDATDQQRTAMRRLEDKLLSLMP